MALIGISGKISSGKDTVGKIIQYLTENKEYDLDRTYKEYLDDLKVDELNNRAILLYKDFHIKKFADKLKDIVCLLINCTREQLEDAEFKNTELGEEWRRWRLKIPSYNLDREDKATLELLFNSDTWEYNNKQPYYNTSVCEVYSEILTPRLLLQLLGTECGRNIIHPNVWVNTLMSEYNCPDCGWYENHKGTMDACHTNNHRLPNWIITDIRFPNELEAVKRRGGITIRVNRPYTTVVGGNGIPATFNQNQFHPSETSLDNANFDYTIENNSTIEDLIHTVSLILKKEKII